MALHVLQPGYRVPVEPGDVVAEWLPPVNGLQRAHLGLAMERSKDFGEGSALQVFHLQGVQDPAPMVVAEARHGGEHVKAVGKKSGLDRVTRRLILRHARSISRRTVPGDQKMPCVFAFEPVARQPVVPNPNNPTLAEFQLSCATFVHYCYQRALGTWHALVDLDRIPMTSDHRGDSLLRPVSEKQVRRLFPGYVMASLKFDCYPFSPTNFLDWRYPYQVLAPGRTCNRAKAPTA